MRCGWPGVAGGAGGRGACDKEFTALSFRVTGRTRSKDMLHSNGEMLALLTCTRKLLRWYILLFLPKFKKIKINWTSSGIIKVGLLLLFSISHSRKVLPLPPPCFSGWIWSQEAPWLLCMGRRSVLPQGSCWGGLFCSSRAAPFPLHVAALTPLGSLVTECPGLIATERLLAPWHWHCAGTATNDYTLAFS